MAHINYQALRGKIHEYKPAEPPTNPHLWVVLEAAGKLWFATINVRSNKDLPGEPIGKSYLYYRIDTDFIHPFARSILSRPQGLSPVERTYAAGALDFQRAGLFDPRDLRILPPQGPGEDGLVHRLGASFDLAKAQGSDVFFYGNAFAKDNPHQTDAAFGYTPDTPFGLDNVHMAQGDSNDINMRLHENGVWHDGACFTWDEQAKRMTAIFLAFQAQAWHTNDQGDHLYGVTGAEAPAYDFAKGDGTLVAPPPRAASLTSVHRGPGGSCSTVVTNMGAAPIDLSGWAVTIDAGARFALPNTQLPASQPLSVPLPDASLDNQGGVLMLLNAANLSVHCVAYLGGDPASGWSMSLT
jgi:uncharacterized protein YukJ